MSAEQTPIVLDTGGDGDGVVREILREVRKQARCCVERMSHNQQDRLLGLVKRRRLHIETYILSQVTEKPKEDGGAAVVPPRDSNKPEASRHD